ncbi:hypothetical protein PAESOLCIP111_02617 [Paenibacillus solanacearum]|uniref:Uncharacterized protein n=1 Tax=Paenibacillus solanacearum TaxID=2048548 RepID=A0A916K216_9BACL|nr:hypothetical protein [Paenibacillus solanacearum]CAG7624399.1 hypothetical protein PAESOLCIP111_02617 [Paenibacillus solanacearum]
MNLTDAGKLYADNLKESFYKQSYHDRQLVIFEPQFLQDDTRGYNNLINEHRSLSGARQSILKSLEESEDRFYIKSEGLRQRISGDPSKAEQYTKLLALYEDSYYEMRKNKLGINSYYFEKINLHSLGMGTEGINLISEFECAMLQLEFPMGHPKANTLYSAHPYDKNRYYPLSDFHPLIFEDKFIEAINLLMCLGATKIQIENSVGLSRDFSGDAILSRFPFKIEANYTQLRDSNTQRVFKAEFAEGREPYIPQNIFWYNQDPMWNPIIQGRLLHGLKDFSLFIKNDNDFGIDGNISCKLLALGFQIGGSYKKHESIEWHVSGTF